LGTRKGQPTNKARNTLKAKNEKRLWTLPHQIN